MDTNITWRDWQHSNYSGANYQMHHISDVRMCFFSFAESTFCATVVWLHVCFFPLKIHLKCSPPSGAAESERPSSPLNLSLRHPGLPKVEPKCEDTSRLKSPAALSPSLGVSPPRGASPPTWTPRATASPPSVWSRGETARIWSPAVTCEKENSLSTSSNNNNNIEAKVYLIGALFKSYI